MKLVYIQDDSGEKMGETLAGDSIYQYKQFSLKKAWSNVIFR